jgi:uncharacterized OB-fold protein
MFKKSTLKDITCGDNHGLSNAARLKENGFARRGKGEVYSYTVMHDAPAGFDETTPYAVVLVKLEEGPVVTAQLTDLGEEQPRIGMPVDEVIYQPEAVGVFD